MSAADKPYDAESVVRHFYAATAARDFAALQALLSPDVVVDAPLGQAVVGGHYEGAQNALQGVWGRLAAHWEGLAAHVHEVYRCDSHRVLARGSYSGTNKETKRPLKTHFAHFWTVHNGQVTELTVYCDTALWNYAWGKAYAPTVNANHAYESGNDKQRK
jgi:uncharacterized protein